MLIVSSGENFLRLMLVLFIFVAVLVMARYATKWIAGYEKQMMSGRNMEVIETLRVSNNKFLAIVRIGKERLFVIGVGKDEVTMVGEIGADELLAVSEVASKGSERSAQDFGAALDMFKKHFGHK